MACTGPYLLCSVINQVTTELLSASPGVEITHSTRKCAFLRQITIVISVTCIFFVSYCLSY